MDKLHSIIAYLCVNYPYKEDLSKARLTKLVYLADWFSALADNKQLTNINWLFNHYGPYVDDVIDSIKFNPKFNIDRTSTMYGTEKSIIGYDGDFLDSNLTPRDKQILQLVITKTSTMYFNDFINYVYSTHPVQTSNRYSNLDLVSLAHDYKNQVNH
ncbi:MULTISPECIES: Panacea domain-containing protein [unclassified Serratia (in: enterobacteria)]|uniref:Panacea domain-containing protein n=1 Tax=unclassified Serratia (in: enterobacteria) TaxID=2647522 RepID=UPI0009073F31|nr:MULTISPECIES: Panacea domain-containing protein [unclassified Serratia (in: enterobacteria)]